MLSKCVICNGSKKIRQMGFMFSTCKACNGEGQVPLDKALAQKAAVAEPEAAKPEVKASGKKGKAASS